jgi:hypothetical protein
MPHDPGKDPPVRGPLAPPRPLARWALAVVLADCALLVGLARVPPLLAMAPEAFRPPPGARLVRGLTTVDHAVFLWRSGAGGHAVIVPPQGASRVVSLDATRWEAALSDPCPALALGPREACETAPRASRATLEGSESSGALTVRAEWSGLTLTARRGFRVERPWIAVGARRHPVTRDVRIEDLVRMDARSGLGGWLAGPRGERLALTPRADALVGERVSTLALLAGRVGTDGLALSAGLWLCAHAVALAAARAEGSSPFWKNFLRWSALVATAIAGGLALAAHRLADGG